MTMQGRIEQLPDAGGDAGLQRLAVDDQSQRSAELLNGAALEPPPVKCAEPSAQKGIKRHFGG